MAKIVFIVDKPPIVTPIAVILLLLYSVEGSILVNIGDH